MDHNPFISRNNDLFIMLLAGCSVVFFHNYVLPLSVQSQFLIVLGIGLMAGLFMNYLYQSLEWALFFAIGVQTVSLLPWCLKAYASSQLNFVELIRAGVYTGEYSLFLLSSWIIAIPTGYMVQKLIMGNYYRRKTL